MSAPQNQTEWIEALSLTPHPEGGYFKEMLASSDTVMNEQGDPRALYTSIYFLLTDASPSHFHRLTADEVWYYHAGESLTVHEILPDGTYRQTTLGPDIANGDVLQHVVPKGTIFGSTVAMDFALVSCLVAPGFEYADFELFTQAALLADHPEHREIIEKLAYVALPSH